MEDSINIRIYLKSLNLTAENASRWINSMCYFEPTEMISKKMTSGKVKKFNHKKFYEAIKEEIENSDRASMMIKDKINTISINKGSIRNDIATISCNLSYDIYEINKCNIMELVDEYIKEYEGIVAYACSLEDMFWQNNENIVMYDIKGKSKEELHTKKSDIFPDDVIVDTEFNPGHSHIVDGIWFGACWRMWYGKEYSKYIPMDIFSNFKNCYENRLYSNDFIRITLYENLWEYDKKENRDRQWEFRKSVGVDELVSILENNDTISFDIDAAIEITAGVFEHGGIRLIKHYYNDKGELIVKSQAIEVKTYELGVEGQLLWSETKKIVNSR
ncbi:hypothetical protein [Clostridium omnivorum]|uniref:DUF4912 domain-containing protein n=1 Tax=Clostridium omnivorum TaxID=1604902 RepID=A0ABQ5N6W8_9CLOT|nr:hypothetical protein [Clostridium sp. E14]GLC30956.1 hypothetical protein bsdE14_23660 [Clostridium sp. E14]